MSVRPEVGDIGVMPHPSVLNRAVIVKVIEQHAKQTSVSFYNGKTHGWTAPVRRRVDSFYHIPDGADLDNVRDALIDAHGTYGRHVAEAVKNLEASIFLIATTGGKV